MTTGRTAGFNGPSLELLGVLSPGTVYQFTASVRLAPGEPATQLIMTDAADADAAAAPVRAGGGATPRSPTAAG